MTRDEIINLAREAGFNPGNYMGGNKDPSRQYELGNW
jgi:hypothetical protein